MHFRHAVIRPKVDRRRDSLIARSALDEVKAIQTLLSDVYKDAGDGRTLVRELVQNADDAKAETAGVRRCRRGTLLRPEHSDERAGTSRGE